MPDVDDVQDGKNYHFGVPMQANAFFLKGSNSLDWGMKNRLARIFNPATARTVCWPWTTAISRGPRRAWNASTCPLCRWSLTPMRSMITRGALRTCIPAEMSKPVVLRSSGGQSILKELSNELVAVDVEDAVRLNASAMAVQVYIGGQHEHQSIGNLVKVVDAGNRHGIPTLAVTGVGKELARDAKYLGLATRICAEMGAHVVKTYFCEKQFCAGGRRLPRPAGNRGRQEAAGAGRAEDGVRGHRSGRRRSGYGPQHLSVRRAHRHDPGGARRGARSGEARTRPTSFIFRLKKDSGAIPNRS